MQPSPTWGDRFKARQNSIKKSIASKRYSLTRSDCYSDESFGKGESPNVRANEKKELCKKKLSSVNEVLKTERQPPTYKQQMLLEAGPHININGHEKNKVENLRHLNVKNE